MDIVYTAAVLTICAAEGGSDFGLSGIPDHDRDFNQKIGKYNEEVQLMVSQPAEHLISRSRWNTRAWTLELRDTPNRL